MDTSGVKHVFLKERKYERFATFNKLIKNKSYPK